MLGLAAPLELSLPGTHVELNLEPSLVPCMAAWFTHPALATCVDIRTF